MLDLSVCLPLRRKIQYDQQTERLKAQPLCSQDEVLQLCAGLSLSLARVGTPLDLLKAAEAKLPGTVETVVICDGCSAPF